MKRAALYIRVSSQGQVRDGYSLAFQEEILREFCQRESLEITQMYTDGGQSGATIHRTALTQLITDARDLKFDIVLIFRVDRFSRDPLDLLALIRELESRQIKLRSVTEAVDAGDPAGELMLTILGAIGKFVRRNILQNAMLGKTKRAESGRFTGGSVPFGFTVNEQGQYEHDTQHWWNGLTAAEVAKLVYSEFINNGDQGMGCLALANHLNQMGVRPPRKVWARASLYQILTNPVYCGDFSWNKRSHGIGKVSVKHQREEWLVVPNAHNPIVSRETWTRAQEILVQNRRTGGPKPKVTTNPIVGFMRCAECGAALTLRHASPSTKYHYFTCMSKYSELRTREGTACGDYPFYRAQDLEQLIWGALVRMAGDPTHIEEIRRIMNDKSGPQLQDAEHEVTRLTARLKHLEQQAMRLTTSFSEGRLPEYLWEGQLHRIEQDRIQASRSHEAAMTRANELKGQTVIAASIEEIQSYLGEVLADCTDTSDRREALGILTGPRGIKVSGDGTIDFDLRIPLDLADSPQVMAYPEMHL